MRNFALAIAFTLCASVASAALTSVKAVQTDVANAPVGFTVNDILIDFDTTLTGQQMVLKLTAGSIYNTAAVGADTAPNGAFFGGFPELAADSFVTIGGPTVGTSESVLVVGGSTEIPGENGAKLFDDSGINFAWAPAAGVSVTDGTDYMVARITLSDDAEGTVLYFGSAGAGTDIIFPAGNISGGVVSFVPEPTTAMLAVLGMVGFAARRRV